MTKFTLFTAFLLISLLLVPQEQRLRFESEYIKSSLIVRLADYIHWPPEAEMDDTSKPFVIGVIGETDFGAYIKHITRDVKAADKKIETRIFLSPAEITRCHFLIISGKFVEDGCMPEVLEKIKNKPVITISEGEGMVEKGVHVSFYKCDKRIRFDVNAGAFKSSPLAISFDFLKYARNVIGKLSDANENN